MAALHSWTMAEGPPDSSEPESEPEPEPESVLIPWQWIGKACITYLMMSIGVIFLEGVAETAWYIKIKEMILERKVLPLPALFFFLCTLSCLYALITCRGAIEADLEDVDQIVCAIFHSLVNSLRPRMSSLTFPLPWLLTNKRGQKWLWIAGTAGVSVISMVLRNSCSDFSSLGGLEVPASPPSSTVCIGDLPARLPPCPSTYPPAARLNYLTPTERPTPYNAWLAPLSSLTSFPIKTRENAFRHSPNNTHPSRSRIRTRPGFARSTRSKRVGGGMGLRGTPGGWRRWRCLGRSSSRAAGTRPSACGTWRRTTRT
jgi:hypothetical protein